MLPNREGISLPPVCVDLLSSALNRCHYRWWGVSNYGDCVELLLKAGAKITQKSLSFAAKDGTERCVKLMLEAGADPNAMLSTAAPRHNILEILINEGADVNFFDKFTALASAVDSKASRSLDLLLQAGADVNITDGNGDTALHFSFCHVWDNKKENIGRIRCTKTLLKAGIKVNVFNIRGVYGDEKKSNALMFCRQHDIQVGGVLKIHKKAYQNTVKQRDLLLLAAGEKPDVKPE